MVIKFRKSSLLNKKRQQKDILGQKKH